MAKHRLINCEFLQAGAFKNGISNKAKLLYHEMLFNGDDKGFVDTVQDIITTLEKNDELFNKTIPLELLENTYNSAIQELIDMGYVYEFKDNHGNRIYLVRHWFYHNRLIKGLWTNYGSFKDMVIIKNNEYIMKPLKEDKINESNVNQDKDIEEYLKPTQTEEVKSGEYDDLPFPVDYSKLKKGKNNGKAN